jgi:hypothetical protein
MAVACLPTAVSLLLLAALFIQISGVSLTLTWPLRLCLLRVLLCTMPLLQTFPFPSTLGEMTLHPLSQAGVFIYSSRGKWVFPLSCGVFLPPPLLQAFLLLVAGRVPPLLPSTAGLFINSSVRNSPPHLFSAQCAPPSLPCVFIVLTAYYSVSLFPPGGGPSVQGAMLIWPRVVCGIPCTA